MQNNRFLIDNIERRQEAKKRYYFADRLFYALRDGKGLQFDR